MKQKAMNFIASWNVRNFNVHRTVSKLGFFNAVPSAKLGFLSFQIRSSPAGRGPQGSELSYEGIKQPITLFQVGNTYNQAQPAYKSQTEGKSENGKYMKELVLPLKSEFYGLSEQFKIEYKYINVQIQKVSR